MAKLDFRILVDSSGLNNIGKTIKQISSAVGSLQNSIAGTGYSVRDLSSVLGQYAGQISVKMSEASAGPLTLGSAILALADIASKVQQEVGEIGRIKVVSPEGAEILLQSTKKLGDAATELEKLMQSIEVGIKIAEPVDPISKLADSLRVRGSEIAADLRKVQLSASKAGSSFEALAQSQEGVVLLHDRLRRAISSVGARMRTMTLQERESIKGLKDDIVNARRSTEAMATSFAKLRAISAVTDSLKRFRDELEKISAESPAGIFTGEQIKRLIEGERSLAKVRETVQNLGETISSELGNKVPKKVRESAAAVVKELTQPLIRDFDNLSGEMNKLLRLRMVADRLRQIVSVAGERRDLQQLTQDLNQLETELREVDKAAADSLKSMLESWKDVKNVDLAIEYVEKQADAFEQVVKKFSTIDISEQIGKMVTSFDRVVQIDTDKFAKGLERIAKAAEASNYKQVSLEIANLTRSLGATQPIERATQSVSELTKRISKLTTDTKPLAQQFENLRSLSDILVITSSLGEKAKWMGFQWQESTAGIKENIADSQQFAEAMLKSFVKLQTVKSVTDSLRQFRSEFEQISAQAPRGIFSREQIEQLTKGERSLEKAKEALTRLSETVDKELEGKVPPGLRESAKTMINEFSEPLIRNFEDLNTEVSKMLQLRHVADRLRQMASMASGGKRDFKKLRAELSQLEKEIREVDETTADSLRSMLNAWKNVKNIDLAVEHLDKQANAFEQAVEKFDLSEQISKMITSFDRMVQIDTEKFASGMERISKAATAGNYEQVSIEVSKLLRNLEDTQPIEKATRSLGGLAKRVAGLTTGTKSLAKRFESLKSLTGILISSFNKWDRRFSQLLIRMGVFSSGFMIIRMIGNAFREMFEAADQAAKVDEVSNSFKRMALATKGAIVTINQLQEAVNYTVDAFTLAQKASLGLAAGLPVERFGELFDAGRKLAYITGREESDAIERLVDALSKLERRRLDELGIVVKLSEATKAAADMYGKSTDEVTKAEQQQAFFNLVLARAKEITANVSSESFRMTEQFAKLKAAASDLKTAFGKFLLPVAVPLVTAFGDMARSLANIWKQSDTVIDRIGAMGAEATKIAEARKILEEMERVLGETASSTEEANKQTAKFNRLYEQLKGLLPELQAPMADTNDRLRVAKERLDELVQSSRELLKLQAIEKLFELPSETETETVFTRAEEFNERLYEISRKFIDLRHEIKAQNESLREGMNLFSLEVAKFVYPERISELLREIVELRRAFKQLPQPVRDSLGSIGSELDDLHDSLSEMRRSLGSELTREFSEAIEKSSEVFDKFQQILIATSGASRNLSQRVLSVAHSLLWLSASTKESSEEIADLESLAKKLDEMMKNQQYQVELTGDEIKIMNEAFTDALEGNTELAQRLVGLTEAVVEYRNKLATVTVEEQNRLNTITQTISATEQLVKSTDGMTKTILRNDEAFEKNLDSIKQRIEQMDKLGIKADEMVELNGEEINALEKSNELIDAYANFIKREVDERTKRIKKLKDENKEIKEYSKLIDWVIKKTEGLISLEQFREEIIEDITRERQSVEEKLTEEARKAREKEERERREAFNRELKDITNQYSERLKLMEEFRSQVTAMNYDLQQVRLGAEKVSLESWIELLDELDRLGVKGAKDFEATMDQFSLDVVNNQRNALNALKEAYSDVSDEISDPIKDALKSVDETEQKIHTDRIKRLFAEIQDQAKIRQKFEEERGRIRSLTIDQAQREKEVLEDMVNEYRQKYGEETQIVQGFLALTQALDEQILSERLRETEQFLDKVKRANTLAELSRLESSARTNDKIAEDQEQLNRVLRSIGEKRASIIQSIEDQITKATKSSVLERIKSRLQYLEDKEQAARIEQRIDEKINDLAVEETIKANEKIEQVYQTEIERKLAAIEERYEAARKQLDSVIDTELRTALQIKITADRISEIQEVAAGALAEMRSSSVEMFKSMVGLDTQTDKTRSKIKELLGDVQTLLNAVQDAGQRQQLQQLGGLLTELDRLAERKEKLDFSETLMKGSKSIGELADSFETSLGTVEQFYSLAEQLARKQFENEEDLTAALQKMQEDRQETGLKLLEIYLEQSKAVGEWAKWIGLSKKLMDMLGSSLQPVSGTVATMVRDAGEFALSIQQAVNWGIALSRSLDKAMQMDAELVDKISVMLDSSAGFITNVVTVGATVIRWVVSRYAEAERKRREATESFKEELDRVAGSFKSSLVSAITTAWEEGVDSIDTQAIVKKLVRERVAEQIANVMFEDFWSRLSAPVSALLRAKTTGELQSAARRIQMTAQSQLPAIENRLITVIEALGQYLGETQQTDIGQLREPLEKSNALLSLIVDNTRQANAAPSIRASQGLRQVPRFA